MAEDIPGDARLLTYAELGALLGIEPESAKRRAVRHGRRRVPGNEGRTLVAVPRTAIPEKQPAPGTAPAPGEGHPGDVVGDRSGDVLPDMPGAVPGRPGDTVHALSVASAALAELRAAMLTAEQRRSEAEERAGRAEGEAAALRERGRAQQERDATRIREAEAAQEALKAELAE